MFGVCVGVWGGVECCIGVYYMVLRKLVVKFWVLSVVWCLGGVEEAGH